jgi:prepilin-type processing-associated H-X9-DG protein
MKGTRRPFSWTDLFVITGILALLIAIVVPSIIKVREEAGRQRCPTNLRQIGQAIVLYMNDNKGHFPRTSYKAGAPPVWGTGALSANPFAGKTRPQDNDVTAALFLLIRTQEITPSVFVCPSTDATSDLDSVAANVSKMGSNFTDWRTNLSYSLSVPYVNLEEDLWKRRFSNDAEFALAADLNPGVGDGFDVTSVSESSSSANMCKANSRNHGGAGQNVLFADGHVEFVTNPFCGAKKDNIYTVSGGADGALTTSKIVTGLPAWNGDSVLLPAQQ